jgi:hypothetical protein
MKTSKKIKTVPVPEVLKRIGEKSRQRGTDKLTMGEITEEIKAYRREKPHASAKAGH